MATEDLQTAASFDGSGSYIDCGKRPEFKVPHYVTVEAWINATRQLKWAGIVGNIFDTGRTESGYGLTLDGAGGVYFTIETATPGNRPYVPSGAHVQLNQWHHVAASFDGQQIRVFVDGRERATKAVNAPQLDYSPENPLRIGAYWDDNERYMFQGQIAEVRLWNRARSASELQADMHRRLQGDEKGLVGYWPLSENHSNTAHDQSAHGNDGEAHSVTWSKSELPLSRPKPAPKPHTVDHSTIDGESLGGQFVGDPAAACSGEGRADVFVRGMDNALWHKCYDGQWHEWQSLGGVLAGQPTVASWGAGRLDVFFRGENHCIWHACHDGKWHELESLGGDLSGDPAVASLREGHLHVFARGRDGELWHRWFWDRRWYGWQRFGGRTSVDAPAVVTEGRRIHVVAGEAYGALLYRCWDCDHWRDWIQLDAPYNGTPALVSPEEGHLQLYVRAIDSTLWRRSWRQGQWQPWQPLSGRTEFAPAAVAEGPRLYVGGIGADGRLSHSCLDDDSDGPWKRSGERLVGKPAFVSRGIGATDVFARGVDNGLWRIALALPPADCILAHLSERDGIHTPEQLTAALNIPLDQVHQALEQLMEAKRVDYEHGRYGTPEQAEAAREFARRVREQMAKTQSLDTLAELADALGEPESKVQAALDLLTAQGEVLPKPANEGPKPSHHWPFSTFDSGNKQTPDVAGDKPITVGESAAWAAGKGLTFQNEKQRHVALGSALSFTSISFWIRRASVATSKREVLFCSPKFMLRIKQHRDNPSLSLVYKGTGDYLFKYEVPVGEWVQLTLVRASDDLCKLYVNGAFTEDLKVSATLPLELLHIGEDHSKGGYEPNADLDELKLFDTPLSVEEVGHLFRASIATNPRL